MYEKHLIVKGDRCDSKALSDVKLLESLVVGIIHAAGMRLLSPIQIYEVPLQIENLGKEPFEDEGGVTAFGILSTSHVAIHTWPLQEYFKLNVYSCKNFDQKLIREIVKWAIPGEHRAILVGF